MTEQNQISLPDEVLNTILTGGLDGLPQAVSLLINHAMLIERHRHLGAAPYERAPVADQALDIQILKEVNAKKW